MMKKISSFSLALSAALTMAACGGETPKPEVQKTVDTFACKQENVLAPKWTCAPTYPASYAGLGVAQKSAAGTSHMRRVALMNGRSDLAQQIKSQVKDKIEGFTRVTGNGSDEVVDQVSTSVTKQVAKINLSGSKAVDYWAAPSGAIYLLVAISEKSVNEEAKKAFNGALSSFKNDNALWQQFQSKKAMESLDNEFPSE